MLPPVGLCPGFSEQREKLFAESRLEPIGESLVEAMDADTILHVTQIQVPVTPDSTRDPKLSKRLKSRKAHPVQFHESVRIRWGIYHGALFGACMLTRCHHVNVHLMFSFAQPIAEALGSRGQISFHKRRMDLVESSRGRQDSNVLCRPHKAILAEAQSLHDGKTDSLFRQSSPAQYLHYGGDVSGMYVVPPQEFDKRPGDLLLHTQILPCLASERKRIRSSLDLSGERGKTGPSDPHRLKGRATSNGE